MISCSTSSNNCLWLLINYHTHSTLRLGKWLNAPFGITVNRFSPRYLSFNRVVLTNNLTWMYFFPEKLKYHCNDVWYVLRDYQGNLPWWSLAWHNICIRIGTNQIRKCIHIWASGKTLWARSLEFACSFNRHVDFQCWG